jgi:hypothetical protein
VTPGEFTPVEVAVLKGRTSKSSLGGKIMSTEILTVVVSTALIAGLFTITIVELYRRRLAAAALSAFATCSTAHIVFVMSAWKGAAVAYLDAPTMESAAWPPISSLPTVAYDSTAWAAVVFLMASVVLGAIEWKRRRVAEKEMAAFLMDILGVDKSKENESEKD